MTKSSRNGNRIPVLSAVCCTFLLRTEIPFGGNMILALKENTSSLVLLKLLFGASLTLLEENNIEEE